MRFPPWPTLAAALVVIAAAPAQESAPDSRARGAKGLIALLDSDDFATREAATRDLVALGPAGREALIEARDGGSLERRARIDQVLQAMLVRADSRPSRRDATRITIDARNTPLLDVVADVAAKARYPIRVAGGSDVPVTLSLQDAPFFEVLDRVCAAASARFSWNFRHRCLLVEPTTETPSPAAYAGPARIGLTMLMVSRHHRFGGPPANPPGSANLQVRIDVEERAGAIGVAMPFRVSEAVDDLGHSLAPPDSQQGQQYVGRFDLRRQIAAFVPIGVPRPDAKSIARLAFVVPLLVPTEVYEAEIQSPEEGAEARAGAFGVTVSKWKAADGRVEVELAIVRPQVLTSAPIQSGTPLSDDAVTFVSVDGAPIVPDAPELVPSPHAVSYAAVLPATPTVGAIRVTCLKGYEIVDLPVVFRDVPLP